jgi:hypothetical protein
LAAVLLVAAFLPLMLQEGSDDPSQPPAPDAPYNVIHLHALAFASHSELSLASLFLISFPVIAAVALLVVAYHASTAVRSGTLMALGGVHWAVIVWLAFVLHGHPTGSSTFAGRLVVGVTFFGGLTCLLAGSLARLHRPANRFAAYLALGGGVLAPLSVVVALVMALVFAAPAGAPTTAPQGNDHVETPDYALPLLALGALSFLTACILSFVNVRGRSDRSARRLAKGICICLSAVPVMLVLGLLSLRVAVGRMAAFLPQLLLFGKAGMWFVACFLLLPLGAAAWIVLKHDEAAHHAECP